MTTAALAAIGFPAAGLAAVVGEDGKRAASADRIPPRTGDVQIEQIRAERFRDERRREQRLRRQQQFATLPGGVSMTTLEAIAACESGGDPAAVSADGTYRGKYQFDYGTWASVGGSGDPAAAPEAEQDYRAALLYAQAGSSPWPVCGV